MTDIKYQSGFGSHFATEALANTLPKGQNSPQKVAYGLFAEQVNGTAFTAPRHENFRSWLYRIRPSVVHSGKCGQIHQGKLRSAPFDELPPTPEQMRWDPVPIPDEPTNFVQGLVTLGGNGSVDSGPGCAIHVYAANQSMTDSFFYNTDGELLIVPQQGTLAFYTEMGILELKPGEIAVIPRGIRFQVRLLQENARGYVCENYGQPFCLPGLGPIGANGLANHRDFLYPVAHYEDRSGEFPMTIKYLGNLWQTLLKHSPLDVVAWHGNFAPYKYDLNKFQAINAVNFDHPDPSIFTVLTSPSGQAGTANIDFVIFPPRWMVAERTFRPPYFHRNYMSEFMGLILGAYDGKAKGFVPGGASMHNRMSAHGPDAKIFEAASNGELKPTFLDGTLAFMFESHLPVRPTHFAVHTELRQEEYLTCWEDLKSHFSASEIE